MFEQERVPREIKAISPVRLPAVRAEQAVLRPVAGFRRTLSDERERRRKVFLDRGELARRSSKATTIRRRHGPTDVVSDRARPTPMARGAKPGDSTVSSPGSVLPVAIALTIPARSNLSIAFTGDYARAGHGRCRGGITPTV